MGAKKGDTMRHNSEVTDYSSTFIDTSYIDGNRVVDFEVTEEYLVELEKYMGFVEIDRSCRVYLRFEPSRLKQWALRWILGWCWVGRKS